MDDTLRGVEKSQQEQLRKFINTLPKDVRKEKAQEIQKLQSNVSKSLRVLSENGSYAGSRGGSRTGRESAPSLPSTAASSRSVQSARQVREVAQTPRRGGPLAFTPSSRRSSEAAFDATLPRGSVDGQQLVPARTPPGGSMDMPLQRKWSAPDTHLPVDPNKKLPVGISTEQHRPDKDPYGDRPSWAASSLESSVYSGVSTPVAGRTWGHLTRVFGNGIGRVHFVQPSHIQRGYVAMNDRAGGHGHNKDDDMESGIERCIGHGRRYLGGSKVHLKGGQCLIDDTPGLYGHNRGHDFVDGMERMIGKGRKKFMRKDHITDDWESNPGNHGHAKQHDFKDGLEWFIGHGKKRVDPCHSRETWRETPLFHPDSPDVTNIADMRCAGMSSRDIHIHHMSRDPRRQGTHQDRRHIRLNA